VNNEINYLLNKKYLSDLEKNNINLKCTRIARLSAYRNLRSMHQLVTYIKLRWSRPIKI